ncbi:MAG: HEAT repeat domain-containing protein [Merismopedia sp. SIO2A8]|nr:HEAT repeat domain-containing protein [Symploca sp. SIO2B6]NET52735.1 HEAT repeat domain-containing protein [Merismopedia sp. SIO2A8]
MDLQQIQTYLNSENPQERMKGIVELRHHEPTDVVPLLKQRMHDQEFMVRSFVAMGLGHKRTEEGFSALLDFIDYEKDPNVIAEAANSLSKFGEASIPYLRQIFMDHPHWLVRQSIFAVFEDIQHSSTLLELCRLGMDDTELVVQFAAIANLGRLASTQYEPQAMESLTQAAQAENPQLRIKAARTLRHFQGSDARALLNTLRQDDDHRVVGAALEGLLP